MRCQCSICAELYEHSSQIAALPCGHTFHNECVMQWIRQSKTCPQCRKKVLAREVIHHLFFDQADGGEDQDEEYAKLKNDLGSAQAAIRQRELEKADLVMETKLSAKKVEELGALMQVLQVEVREEKTANAGMKKELRSYQKLIAEAEEAKEDASRVRKKLEGLTMVQQVVNDCENDVEALISRYHGDSKALATWCAVLQKELATKKKQCRMLRETNEKATKELLQRKNLLREKINETKSLKELYHTAESDIKSLERENDSLKQKLEQLENSSDLSTSFAQRFIHESPAPEPPCKRPRLSLPEGVGTIDFDQDGAEKPTASPTVHQKKACKEYGTQFVKISSMATTYAKKPKRDIHDISNLPLNGYNLFKKSVPGQQSSVFRQGYNGMGSHDKFIQPTGRPRPQLIKKPAPKTSIFKPRVPTLKGATPPLPRLDTFISD